MSPIAKPPNGDKPGKPLKQVLGHSERVKHMVQECADELSGVNADLKEELTDREPLPAIQKFLEKSENVEDKAQAASEELSIVNRALGREVKERHALEAQLAAITEQEQMASHAALHDLLTGLPNRALFADRLEHGLAQALRHERVLAVMFLDLNDFKAINDAHGHDVGDGVLRTFAARLKDNTRSDDTVSRYGGDEFLSLLTEINGEGDIASIADKLVAALHAPFDIGTSNGVISLSIRASIGIAVFPKDGTTPEALIKSADTAMYVSKRNKSAYSFAQ